jgi:hypothetical protein
LKSLEAKPPHKWKILLGSGGTSLTLAQRFNAGFGNEVTVESRGGRKKRSAVPMGLNKEERILPSVKTLGYFQFGPEYYEMAKQYQ